MTKQRIKKIGVLQTSMFLAIIVFVLSVIGVLIMSVFLNLFKGMSIISFFPFEFSTLLLLPFLYAGLAFIGTALGCLFYNLLAKKMGGIEIEVEVVE